MYEVESQWIETVWNKQVQMSYRKNTNDDLVIYSVMIADEYLSKRFDYADKDVFIDLGAHIGTWTALMSSFNHTFKVYAYEPIPENFELLQRNIKQNNLNAIPFRLAISIDSIGKEKIYYTPDDTSFGSQHKFVGSARGGANEIEVDRISVDDIFSNNNIEKCRVLKTDCESCEIKGFSTVSKETLQKIDYIVGEFHPGNRHDFFLFFEPYFEDISNLITQDMGNFSLQRFLFKNRRLKE